jgi:magnesium transporter
VTARESAMVVNLEFVKTIITAEEVYLLDPHNKYVEAFVEQLRIQLPLQLEMDKGTTTPQAQGREEGLPEQLPFEFRVLEVALDVVCNYLERKVHDLERMARPALEQLTKTISTSSLELVRTVKSRLTRLNGRVQKVLDLFICQLL